MKLLNKKAAVASTATWIVAVFIIVILLVGYVFACVWIYNSKGSSKLTLNAVAGYSQDESVAMTNFINILNEPLKNKKTILAEIKEEDYASFISEVKSEQFGKKLGSECYLVQLYSGDVLKFSSNFNGLTRANTNFFKIIHIEEYLKKVYEIYIPSDKGSMVKIQIYSGVCAL